MPPAGPTIATVALSHSPQMNEDVTRTQGTAFRKVYGRLAEAVAAYDPTLVCFFGPDHLRALTGLAPCFTVVESAVGYGDWGTPEENYDVPVALAVALGRHLASVGIDLATAAHLRLDHGFGQSTSDILGSLNAVPLLPIVINCVDRPIPLAARCALLGSAVGDFLRSNLPTHERVLVIGSGGLSHEPPSLVPGARNLSEADRRALIAAAGEHAADALNPDWDRDFLEQLASPQWRDLSRFTPDDIVPGGAGGVEILTWIAAAFAGGTSLRTAVYEPVPEWITGMGIAVSDHLALT